MLDPSDPIVEAAVLGEQIRQFLSTEIGEYLIDCANNDKSTALSELLKVDADDSQSIRRIQLKLLVADKITGWLAQAIESGVQAIQYLDTSK